MEGPQSGRVGVRGTWALLALLVLGTCAWVATPALLLQPFKAQTPFGVALTYELRQRAPLVTLVGLILSLPLLARLARRVTRWRQWPPLVAVALAVVAGSAVWLARQNHFEWMFNPLPDPTYAPATLVRSVDDSSRSR